MRLQQRETLNKIKSTLRELYSELSHELLELVKKDGRITQPVLDLQDRVSKIETCLFLLKEC